MLEKEHQHFSFYEKPHKEKITVKVGTKVGKLLLNASQLMGTLVVGLLVVGVTASAVKDARTNYNPAVVALPVSDYEKIQKEGTIKMEKTTNEFNVKLYHLKNKGAILKMIGEDSHVEIDILTKDTILFSHIQEEKYSSHHNYYVVNFNKNKTQTIYIRYPNDSKLNYLKSNNIPFTILKKQKQSVFNGGDLIKIDIK